MQWWQALLLGIVQGVTEFLPVSSDGHLVLVQNWLQLSTVPVTFDIMLHAGTLITTIAFFWKPLRQMRQREWFILICANIPVILLGIFLRPHLEALAASRLVVAGSFLTTALFLWISDLIWHQPPTSSFSQFNQWVERIDSVLHRLSPRLGSSVSFLQAMGIGLFQAIALLPGVSRSASSLAGGAVVGLRRDQAFPFAFLLGVPAITGAVLYDLFFVLESGQTQSHPWGLYALGAVCAGVSGWFALQLLARVVQYSRLRWFAIYCVAVSVLSFFML